MNDTTEKKDRRLIGQIKVFSDSSVEVLSDANLLREKDQAMDSQVGLVDYSLKIPVTPELKKRLDENSARIPQLAFVIETDVDSCNTTEYASNTLFATSASFINGVEVTQEGCICIINGGDRVCYPIPPH